MKEEEHTAPVKYIKNITFQDYENPDNININDVLGDYSLTLIDTLDTLAIIGNYSGYCS